MLYKLNAKHWTGVMQKLDEAISKDLAKLFAKRFISRTDVFAQQLGDGSYRPVRRKITLNDLLAHLNGEKTFGHYLLDADANTKIFCIDVDFNPEGWIPGITLPDDETNLGHWEAWDKSFSTRNLRADQSNGAWFKRSDPAREYLKGCLREIAEKLLKITKDVLKVPAIAAYSGHKGVHVYGFLAYDQPGVREVKRVSAEHARIAAEAVLNESKWFTQKSPGSVFWTGKPEYATAGLFTCEVYPKQTDHKNTELGNLLRLPLGKNLKRPGDPTFWIDTTTTPALRPGGIGILAPLDNKKVLEIHS